ncbi:MAG: radical SAM protein, partial [Clostridia bacterium]|nr:radical SAM protein [Clostridia bacterium]
MRISVISLGCCKNRVDTEQALFVLRQAGHTFVEEKDADAVLINTCGFLAAAKEEALETIAEVKGINPTAQIIAVGCLAQREPELLKNIPGVTATLGIGKHLIRPRILSTSPDLAYLRIADGCDNRCAYCAIPDIRGPYRAAPFDDILNEAKHFVQGGVKELCVVAQDTTRYPRLPDLLCALADIDADVWVRFLYAYPEMITPELLDAIESRPNICRYIDVPIQHTHDDILRSMNRRNTTADLANMMKLIRKRKEKYALRTT